MELAPSSGTCDCREETAQNHGSDGHVDGKKEIKLFSGTLVFFHFVAPSHSSMVKTHEADCWASIPVS